MASPKPAAEDTAALVDHFRNLSFEGKKTVLTELQAIIQEEAQKERAGLLARLAELDSLTGRPSGAAPNHASERDGRTGKPAPIKYYDPKTGNHSSGRGSWQKSDWVKAHVEAGGTIEELLVSEKNPLPAHLQ